MDVDDSTNGGRIESGGVKPDKAMASNEDVDEIMEG
jgi:hypothetical protein